MDKLIFQAAGTYNGTAVARDWQTQSWWSPGEGVCFHGPLAGRSLQRIPVFQGSFQDYGRLHPDGEVMLYDHPHHRDGRHGHGSNFTPGGEGIGDTFLQSLELSTLDPRLKENELILGIDDELGLMTLPVVELRKEGNAIHFDLSGVPVVALALPGTHTAGAYRRLIDGHPLRFSSQGREFVDDRGGSRWTVEGQCVAGPMAGRALEPLDFVTLKWHVFAAHHPTTPVYQSSRTRATEPIEDPVLREAVHRLGAMGGSVDLEWPLLEAVLPERARSGAELVADGHPLRVFHFESTSDAGDWARCWWKAVSSGCLAVGSFPAARFTDATQDKLLPLDQIGWAPVVTDGRAERILAEVNRGCRETHLESPPLGQLLDRLKAAGMEVSSLEYLFGSQLHPSMEVGFQMDIEGDRWQLVRDPSAEEARRESERRGHCILAGRFVLWSDPSSIYTTYTTITRPDDKVRWSRLLANSEFSSLVRAALT